MIDLLVWEVNVVTFLLHWPLMWVRVEQLFCVTAGSLKWHIDVMLVSVLALEWKSSWNWIRSLSRVLVPYIFPGTENLLLLYHFKKAAMRRHWRRKNEGVENPFKEAAGTENGPQSCLVDLTLDEFNVWCNVKDQHGIWLCHLNTAFRIWTYETTSGPNIDFCVFPLI